MFGLSRNKAEDGADGLIGREDARSEVDGEVLRGGEGAVHRHLLRIVVLEFQSRRGDRHSSPMDEARPKVFRGVRESETGGKSAAHHQQFVGGAVAEGGKKVMN